MPDEKKDPVLAGFAAQVEALRESRLPAKVGVMLPTYNRPDLLRSGLLQLAVQSRVPDLICVHQNGLSDSYRWVIEDLRIPSKVAWLHTPAQLPQHEWYSIPLRHLVEQNCSHFFWADPGDIYLRDHIEKGLEDLNDCDFSVSPRGGLLVTRAADYRYNPDAKFDAHATGGMDSTMCFNRRFAKALLSDIEADAAHHKTSDVVAKVTMPKFRCKVSGRRTAVHHAHEGARDTT